MILLRKPVLITLLTIGVIIFGFIFLLKGCLSKYDERYVKTPALVFEKNGKTVVFSIEEFEKTTSYSRRGSVTNKSVSTYFSIQINDGETAELIDTRKIKNRWAIKSFPVEILGASGSAAWLFMGEPMAFDAFTLEKMADIPVLEEKNPALKGKFPAERQFYQFRREDSTLYFTATDGTKWQLNTRTLLASPADYRLNESPLQRQLSGLEKQLKENQQQLDSLFQQKSYRPGQDYAAKKISYATYQQLIRTYYTENKLLYKRRDSLTDIKQDLEKNKREREDEAREIENLQRTSLGFSQTKSNQDTVDSGWFGLYTDAELEELDERYRKQGTYDETGRRKLYTGTYSRSRFDYTEINKASLKNISPAEFLDGGFLLDKRTARPVFLAGSRSFLIVHKDQVGPSGKIQLSNMTNEGKINWTSNTALTQWNDWILTGKRLYVFGTNKKELSRDETNILLCIDLANGTMAGYDYFSKKKTK